MATHSSILAWRILWTEEPGGLHGVTESDTTERTRRVSDALCPHAHHGPSSLLWGKNLGRSRRAAFCSMKTCVHESISLDVAVSIF